jgi:hypothetical protein
MYMSLSLLNKGTFAFHLYSELHGLYIMTSSITSLHYITTFVNHYPSVGSMEKALMKTGCKTLTLAKCVAGRTAVVHVMVVEVERLCGKLLQPTLVQYVHVELSLPRVNYHGSVSLSGQCILALIFPV